MSILIGYFNRVIMQSGLGTSPQAFNDKDIAKGMTIALARSVNCTFKTSEKILQCLQSKDAESLIRMAKTINVIKNRSEYNFYIF